ncbi:hypothetical protein [Tannerella forsythia]
MYNKDIGDDTMTMIRKNITLPITSYQTINDYAKKCGMSFSEFLRNAALKEIVKSEDLSLLDYISVNCAYLDKHEQEEIEALNINFNNLDGKELTLNELLQG